MEKIKIGVSSCLLGEEVRYDGGHQLNYFIRDVLGRYMEFVPVCPEVECGMPIPREPLRLTGDERAPRLVTSRTGIDYTERMQAWAMDKVRQLEAENLCGFIFKKNSPSSGLYRVKVYSDQGMARKVGVGVFAQAFVRHFPLLPVEEDGRLNDARLREDFVENVFVLRRFRDVSEQQRSRKALIEFHTRHKLLLLARNQEIYRRMGRFIANLPDDVDESYEMYGHRLAEALRMRTTVKKHRNVLLHVFGYFKKELSADDKQEVLELIDAYHEGEVPLIVPITLLNHYIRKFPKAYLQNQYYLHPHPMDLGLRSRL